MLTDLSFAIITIVIPLLLMLVFGLMTISNVRQRPRAVQPAISIRNNQVGINTLNTRSDHQQRTKKTDRQLQLMLLVQVILLAVFSLPLAGQKLYANLTVYDSTTALQVAINNFVYNFALQLTFVASGMPFYIYTLAGGSVFRKAFSELVQSVYGRITCRRMQ